VSPHLFQRTHVPIDQLDTLSLTSRPLLRLTRPLLSSPERRFSSVRFLYSLPASQSQLLRRPRPPAETRPDLVARVADAAKLDVDAVVVVDDLAVPDVPTVE